MTSCPTCGCKNVGRCVALPPPNDDRFEYFWQLYPRKVGKPDAARAWRAMLETERKLATEAVFSFAAVWASAPSDRHQFIRYPATWLRSKGWLDGLEEWRRVALNGHAQARPLPGSHAPAPAPQDRTDEPPAWYHEATKRIRNRDGISNAGVLAVAAWNNGENPTEPDLTPEEEEP